MAINTLYLHCIYHYPRITVTLSAVVVQTRPIIIRILVHNKQVGHCHSLQYVMLILSLKQ